jgi:hypothetical protein
METIKSFFYIYNEYFSFLLMDSNTNTLIILSNPMLYSDSGRKHEARHTDISLFKLVLSNLPTIQHHRQPEPKREFMGCVPLQRLLKSHFTGGNAMSTTIGTSQQHMQSPSNNG